MRLFENWKIFATIGYKISATYNDSLEREDKNKTNSSPYKIFVYQPLLCSQSDFLKNQSLNNYTFL